MKMMSSKMVKLISLACMTKKRTQRSLTWLENKIEHVTLGGTIMTAIVAVTMMSLSLLSPV